MVKVNRILLLLLLTIVGESISSQIIDLGSCTTDSLSPEGFELLKHEIADARIVIIGEQQHGIGTEYESFKHIVKFLHEQMDFNIIAQEFCFYSFGRINSKLSNGGSALKFKEKMYWPQGKSLEMNSLLEYIDNQNSIGNRIQMEGFDSRIFDRKEFFHYAKALINESKFHLLSSQDVAIYLATLQRVLRHEYNDCIPIQNVNIFLAQTSRIIAQLKKAAVESTPRAIQLIENLLGFVKNAWNIKHSKNPIERFHEREKQMAENLIWLTETAYPDEKIIVHMHNGHAAKHIHLLEGIIPDTLIKNAITVGQLLNNKYGDDCLHIASTAYKGTYCNWNFEPKEIPIPHSESIENQLYNGGYKYAYVNTESIPNTNFHMFFNEFNTWLTSSEIKGPFGQIFDGVIFIDVVQSPVSKEN